MPKPKLFPITLEDGTYIPSEIAFIEHRYRTGQKNPWWLGQWFAADLDVPTVGFFQSLRNLWRRFARWVDRRVLGRTLGLNKHMAKEMMRQGRQHNTVINEFDHRQRKKSRYNYRRGKR